MCGSKYTVSPDEFQTSARAHQITDVGELVNDHGWPFQAESPGQDLYVLGEPERQEDLWTEKSRITNLHPSFQLSVEGKDLH